MPMTAMGDSLVRANEATITEKGIADLNAKIELVKDDPVQREKLQDERRQSGCVPRQAFRGRHGV